MARNRWHPANYTDDLALHANTPAQAEPLLHSLEQAARDTVNSDKTEFMYFKQNGANTTLNGKLLILPDQFTQVSCNITST